MIARVKYAKDSDDFDISLKYEEDKHRIVINWSDYETNDNLFYTVYRSEDNGTSFRSVSSFDSDYTSQVKVLNIYPQGTAKVQFTFQDGTPSTMCKSASLKVWMEGGKIGSQVFEGAGKGIIHVDLKSMSESESMTIDDFINYDVIFIGSVGIVTIILDHLQLYLMNLKSSLTLSMYFF